MKSYRGILILVAAFLLALPAALAAQVQIKTGATELKVSGRLQFQLETTTCTELTPGPASGCSSDEAGLDMFVRRARFSLEAKIDERLTFKIEPDFSKLNEIRLKDAWGRYSFSPLVSIRAGHFKRPFDGFEMTSSSWRPFEAAGKIPGVAGEMLPSYTGLTKSLDLSDRDVGFVFEGSTGDGTFSFAAGAFNGGSDSDANDSNAEKQFVGRAQVSLDAEGMPLNLAAGVALTDAPFTALSGEVDAEYFTNFEVFAELGAYSRDGLVVQAGLIVGDNGAINPLGGPIDLAAGEDFASMRLVQAVVGYRLPVEGIDWLEAVSPVVRVSHADPNTDVEGDDAWVVTPGIGLYFHQRNRLTLTWDVANFGADGVDSESSFKAQMQFHF